MTLRDEPGPAEAEPLLAPVMQRGRRLDAPPPLAAAREWFDHDLAGVSGDARRLVDPEQVVVPHSRALQDLTDRATDEALRREDAAP